MKIAVREDIQKQINISTKWCAEIGRFHYLSENLIFFFAVLGLELRTFTLSHSTSPIL
jgi:hypothetical protein